MDRRGCGCHILARHAQVIYRPRIYQRLIRSYGLELGRANIWAGMGLGKSVSCLDIIQTLLMFNEVKRVLILGPNRVARYSWMDELAKWKESFPHLTMASCTGTPDQRKAALAKQAIITTLNYENVEWLCDGYGDRFPFDMVIADESPRLKGLRVGTVTNAQGTTFTRGQGSVRAKAIHRLAHTHVKRWLNLTASPAPNGVIDLWGQQWFIDAGRRLGTSFGAFESRWFHSVANSEGYSSQYPRAHAQKEIEAALKDCSITIASEDYFPVDKVIESRVMIDLPPAARKAYITMEKEFFADIRENRVDVFSLGPRAQKLMQIANGAVWIDREQKHWEVVHDAKLEALRSVMTEANGDPVMIRYCSVPDKERILKAMPKVKFFDDSKRTQDAWNAGDIPGLITHAASTGHGLSLQEGGRILCDYSSDYNMEHDQQIIERLGPVRQAQSGHPRSVYRRRIVARDTIEEHSVLPRLDLKISVENSLKNAMKIRGVANA